MKAILYGTLAYTIITFPIAVIWHVVLFKEKYQLFGYFDGEPNFTLGLMTIIVQGFILSFLYSYVTFQGKAITRGLKYALVMGLFFWTSHVLAFLAKQTINLPISFLVMESFYLILQFGVYGILIGIIYNKFSTKE